MTNNFDFQAAAEVAMHKLVGELKTEPMTTARLASYFCCNRNLMRQVLDHMDDAERFGSLWRVPLARMPPKYHQDQNLIPRG